ncbi:MAG: hypothetical protein MHM6MM_005326 [Cercozoa sp. M6MM]
MTSDKNTVVYWKERLLQELVEGQVVSRAEIAKYSAKFKRRHRKHLTRALRKVTVEEQEMASQCLHQEARKLLQFAKELTSRIVTLEKAVAEVQLDLQVDAR